MHPEIVTYIHEVANTYAHRHVNTLSYEDIKLVSKESKIVAFQKKYEEELTHYVSCISSGLKEIVPKMQALAPFEPELFSDNVQSEIEKLCQDEAALEKAALQALISDKESKSLKELFPLSDGALLGMYRIGAEFYNERAFFQAARVYLLLALLDNEKAVYWLALGDAEYYNQAYANALYAYAACARADPSDPAPHYFAARCYEQLSEFNLANNSLDVLLALVDGEEDADEWSARAKSYKEHLSEARS